MKLEMKKISWTGTPVAVERDEATMKKMMIVERDAAAKKNSGLCSVIFPT